MCQNLRGHLSLNFAALIYGANYTIAKEVLNNNYIQPNGFILFRVLTGFLLFGFLSRFFTREKVARKDYGLFVLCGLFGAAINMVFFFKGLKLTGPIHASLIMTTTPILVLLISAIILKEKITGKKILGILIGALGAILLISYGQEVGFGSQQLLGDVLVFINASSYGIYLVLVKSLMRKYHPFTVMSWVFLIGLCFVFPFGIRDALQINWHTFGPGIWIAFGYVLLFTTFFTYLLNSFALKTLNASVVSIYIYLQPLLASVIALMVGKDELTVEKLLAAALIFVGVFLVSHTKSAIKS